MDKILTELCEELNNFFWKQKLTGTFTIQNGSIDLHEYVQEGQYFRIIDSVFNNGVHKYPATDLKDEVFKGGVWTMAVPETVIALASDIKDWRDKYESADSAMMSPFASESFNNYSYSKSTGGTAGSGDNSNSWIGAFSSRMNKWRRLRGLQ